MLPSRSGKNKRKAMKKTKSIKKTEAKKKKNRPSSQTSGCGDGWRGGSRVDRIYQNLLPTAWRRVAFTGADDSAFLREAPAGRDSLDTVSKSVQIPVNLWSFPPSSSFFFLSLSFFFVFFPSGEPVASSELHFLLIRSSDKRSVCSDVTSAFCQAVNLKNLKSPRSAGRVFLSGSSGSSKINK